MLMVSLVVMLMSMFVFIRLVFLCFAEVEDGVVYAEGVGLDWGSE